MIFQLFMMPTDRIYFQANPWPEGHPIAEFAWTAKVVDGEVWFDLHLKSADYYAERDIDYEDEETQALSDWESPATWNNYHACTLSSTFWGNKGFRICRIEQYKPEFLDGLEMLVDTHPEAIEDWDELAFHIYLLGHDAAAKHRIRFERIQGSQQFKIVWTGSIAAAYVGQYEFKHAFSASISSAQFPLLAGNSQSAP